jgi:hypothetical protein
MQKRKIKGGIMFTEAAEDCRQYILSRAPTARITRSQAVDLDKK